MADIIPPADGEIQIVLLIDDNVFYLNAPISKIDQAIDAFEEQWKLGNSRRNHTDQIRVRLKIVELLRHDDDETAVVRFANVLAIGCLWLALRHYSSGADIRKGMDAEIAASNKVVLSVSVGHSRHSLPGSTWAFMFGDRIYDGRDLLKDSVPNQVFHFAKESVH